MPSMFDDEVRKHGTRRASQFQLRKTLYSVEIQYIDSYFSFVEKLFC